MSVVTGKNRAYIRTYLNRSYKSGCKACQLDLAIPDQSHDAQYPTIVVIHGGGWITGDKSSFASDEHHVPANIVDFARLGFAAATINYRLSKEALYPAAVDDCRDAVRWLRQHADEYGLDARQFGQWGNSAGGHLALCWPSAKIRPIGTNRSNARAACKRPLATADRSTSWRTTVAARCEK